MTRAQSFVMKQKAEKAGVNISDFIRQLVLNGYVKAKWTAEERGMVKQLIGMSVDLHRLVLIAEKEGSTDAVLLFVKYRGIMDSIINTLCHDR